MLELFTARASHVSGHVVTLSEGLRQRGWEVTVAGPAANPALARLEQLGIAVLPLPARDRSLRQTLAALEHALVDHSVLHAHGPGAGHLAGIASRRTGVPSLYTTHTRQSDRRRTPLGRTLGARSERRAARSHRAIVSETERVRSRALGRRLAAPAQIRVIAEGLDATSGVRERADARAQLGLDASARVVCWVGQRGRHERCGVLPLLATRLARDGILFVAIGRGFAGSSEAALLGRCGALVLPDLTEPQLLYAASDVLVSTSAAAEGQHPILEAMRVGLPVVAYADSAETEALVDRETGFLVRPGALETLSRHAARLATHSRLSAEMGEAARQRFEQCFASARMVEAVDLLYREFGAATCVFETPAV